MILIDWLINTIIVYKIQVILSTWSSAHSKLWRLSWTSGETPPALPPLTIMNRTVPAVESFRFMGSTISQELKWDIHIDSIVKKAQQRLYFLGQLRKVQPATRDDEKILLCHHWIRPLHVNNNCLVQLSYQIWPQETTGGSPDYCESLVQPSLLSKNCTYPERAKGLSKSLWTPHIQHTSSLICYRLVDGDATELWAPEGPDIETVSSLRQSISWTLELLTINMKHLTL